MAARVARVSPEAVGKNTSYEVFVPVPVQIDVASVCVGAVLLLPLLSFDESLLSAPPPQAVRATTKIVLVTMEKVLSIICILWC